MTKEASTRSGIGSRLAAMREVSLKERIRRGQSRQDYRKTVSPLIIPYLETWLWATC